ncbi:MAG: hypothetical protein LQ342_005725 [Letrouitia transgressa]|nr:MAG: hypothetical protein LQ342_005725 [Letrouitia transgressa]
MAEPQPSNIHEGVDPTDETPATQPPASAEDRKAAAALSSLDSRNAEEEDSKAQTSKAKNIDQEALRRAISRLEVSSGEKVLGEVSERAKKVAEDKRKEKEAAERRRAIDELDLSKTKATDLLKAHEGDAVKAMRAFVTASV